MSTIKKSDFDYHLPPNFIANIPANPRDSSKLMFINRQTGNLTHHHFYHLPDLINSQFVLVLNQTKVFPARIYGQKTTGGKIELLLIRQTALNIWEIISKPRLKLGQKLSFPNGLKAEVIKENKNEGYSYLKFNISGKDFFKTINQIGTTPIPPYIQSSQQEKEIRQEYQTVFAKSVGSSAAPTAGLHFTQNLLEKLKNRGIGIEYITLHVGPGTFQNLREENIKTKTLHNEEYEIDKKTADNLNQAKSDGKKIIAVGTTTTRTLESNVNQKGDIRAQKSNTTLFIYPPYQFRFIDGLITNFHLPQSSLLMLVSAFASQPQTSNQFIDFKTNLIGESYQQAIENNYRFYSCGDAMIII